MTREAWDALWIECFNRLYQNGRSVEKSREKAWDITEARYGLRPEKALPGLRWRYRILGKVALGRLEGIAKGMKEGSMGQRILNAALYGAAAAFAAVQVSGLPADETGWLALLGVFATGAWGKFSSSTRFIAPNRKPWFPDEPNTGK